MKSVLDLVGNTPLVEVKSLHTNRDVKIFAKLEGFNPSGSIKDRIAKYMIEKGEERGELTQDKVIVESTSGNMGISLAMIGAIKKYKVVLTMSEAKSVERRKIINALGAQLILTSADDPDSNIKKANELYQSSPGKYYMPDQNENEDNCLAHYETTGAEILEQTNGNVDYFICGFGTGGTVMGVSQRLKEHDKNIKIISVEPENPIHIIEGLKSLKEGYVPTIYDPRAVDEVCCVNDEESVLIARKLAKMEGMFVGISSGATMAAALRKANEIEGGNIVVIFADGGLKYLTTRLCEGLA